MKETCSVERDDECEAEPSQLERAGTRAVAGAVREKWSWGEGVLRNLVINVIRQDPTICGQVFVFCNRWKNRVKCLYFDGSGLWVAAKRIERGTLAWPKDEAAVAQMNGAQLQLLLTGYEIRSRRGWYRRGEGLEDVPPV